MFGYESLRQAGFSPEEAYRATRKRLTPELIQSLQNLRQNDPVRFTEYEAQWRAVGIEPPWDDLLEELAS